MEFLKIYDVTKEFKEISCDGDFYNKYYVQEDTHDFHVFRIFEGNYDDENEWGYGNDPEGGYTIERENIPKYEVLEHLGYQSRDRVARDRLINRLAMFEIIKGVVGSDEGRGYANYDFAVYETIDECVKYRVEENGSWGIVNNI